MILKNKIAVVSGAGGVLCSSFSRCLAQNGATVILLDINLESAEAVSNDIRAKGGLAYAFKCDVLNKASI